MPRILLLYITLTISCSATPALGFGYHWPLDGPRALTSTFAEHRAGHLHAGIDLKTWGQEDREVYAVGDGYVWRIRTSPWGYGKALYIRLDDGMTAVYGHLSRFMPSIERRVEEEQRRLGRYSTDFYLQPGEISVRAGQIVAYSGRTGCAHPHLHFELRDAENRPLNPLSRGFSVVDQRPPRLASLSIKPMDWQSAVDGQHGQHFLRPLSWNGAAGHYQISGIPHIEGRVGLALAADDRADNAQNRLNIYALHLYLDDQPIFSATYDRYSFSNTDKVDLDSDYALYRQGRGIYHNLYVAQGNDLPFYQPQPFGSGVIDVKMWPAGFHRVRIRAEDFAGNAREAEFVVLLDRSPRLEDLKVARELQRLEVMAWAQDPDDAVERVWVEISLDNGQSWQRMEAVADPGGQDLYRARWVDLDEPAVLVRAWAEDRFGIRSPNRIASAGMPSSLAAVPRFQCQLNFWHDFVEILIGSDQILAREPRVLLTQPGEKPRPVAVYQLEPDHFRGLAPLIPGLDGDAVLSVTGRDLHGTLGAAGFVFPVQAVTRSQGGKLEVPGQEIEVLFEPGSVYGTFMGRVEQASGSSTPGLTLRSQAYSVYPDDCVFDDPAMVSIVPTHGGAENQRIGLYRSNGGGGWRYVGRLFDDQEGTIGARVRNFSTFALLEDQTTPLIWRVLPRDGSRTRGRRPLISARVRDTGSGIGGEEDVILKLDGQVLISQYDPPVEAVLYQPGDSLAPGEHLLEILVRDRAGNEARAQSRFTVIP